MALSCSSKLSTPRRMFALSVQKCNSPHTWSFESELRRLPVPKLGSSLDAYLESLKPLYLDMQYGSEAAVQRRLWADELEASGTGRTLQQRLLDLDASAPHNWLEDHFWPTIAYHSVRTPLPVNSSWWCLGTSEGLPRSISSSRPCDGDFSDWQVHRASILIHAFVDFKLRLDRADIPPDLSRSGPLCMHQYRRIFGMARVPCSNADHFLKLPYPCHARHILVIVQEQLYSLEVIQSSGKAHTHQELEIALWALISDAESRSHDLDKPVASLTGGDRNSWALNREHLMQISSLNQRSLDAAESALFCLALDNWTKKHPHPENALSSSLLGSGTAQQSQFDQDLDGHILNSQAGGPTPGRSRWFDKTMNLSIESNARVSITGEHSPCEALLPASIFDYALARPLQTPMGKQNDVPSANTAWRRLRWDVDEHIEREIKRAEVVVEQLIEDSDARVLYADEYGAEFIRTQAKVAPDAFVQMALQLAFRRLHGHYTPVYETASTRLFAHGRTETIRSYTLESRAFCEAMIQHSTQANECLRQACALHVRLTRQASAGQGCDRHLMALRLLVQDKEAVPALFSDSLYDASQRWRLSTSGLTAGDRFAGTGFGAPLPDGYGINYLIGAKLIKFGIESKHSSPATNTSQYRIALAEALRDMGRLCENA